MKCQQCQSRSAALHVTKTINGMRKEIHLCESCAMEMSGINVKENDFSLYKLLAGIIKDSISEDDFMEQADDMVATDTCSVCQTTYGQFVKSGKLGCASCYGHFGKRFMPSLKRIHTATEHVGKLPRRNRNEVQIKRRVTDLKALLMRLVAAEEYERATQVRDEIRMLERGGDLA
ncbi:MAG: UvrB/UvrC motif-containing protein [Paenibacillaceae bacterium]|jgi:protein arginine kinase activator|nr:UvrB/UvrC motif-containing protein [Paenibacillaceae bacterium]